MFPSLSQPFEGGDFRTWSVAVRFLAVPLFAAIAIAPANDFLPPDTARANEMEATTRLCSFERPTQQLANPHERE
jgi:hypothetical protein